METWQSELVQLFCEKLKKNLEKHSGLLLLIQRFIEQRNDCKGNLEVEKNHICLNLWKTYYPHGIGNKICMKLPTIKGGF